MSAPVTYDLSLLERSARRWAESPALRTFYHDLWREVLAAAPQGPRLELGSGIGMIREVAPDVVTSDITPTRFVARAVSAYAIKDTGQTWGAVLAVDMLHHLCTPWTFLASAARSLQPGGRIVLAEPAATPLGRWVYRAFHHEPCRPAELAAPWEFSPAAATGEFANMGMGWALFVRDRAATEARLATLGLRLQAVTFRDGLGYLTTGGFSRPAWLPAPVLRALLAAEQALPQLWWRQVGLRMCIVLERDQPAGTPRA